MMQSSSVPNYQFIHQNILTWYDTYGRKSLPWRNTNDPYAIYLSEIMLQQTQVKTVLARFYFPFLERFPSLTSLANAKQEDVLKQWEGLGYYTRARNLHKTAMLTAPALPDNLDALLALPGIGNNTAHAILAFAFHQPVAIMEANVKRILCRFFAIKSPIDKQLWQQAETLLDRDNPFIYNQAMMDIGSSICTPKAPQCEACPLESACSGKTTPTLYPLPKAKKQEKVRPRDIVVYRNQSHEFFLHQRSTRFLNGLYGFLEYDALPAAIATNATKLGNIKQVYSHFTLHADIYLSDMPPTSNDGEWVAFEDFEKHAFSQADYKIIALLK